MRYTSDILPGCRFHTDILVLPCKFDLVPYLVRRPGKMVDIILQRGGKGLTSGKVEIAEQHGNLV
jgi:hypothetical protein